MVSRTGAAPVFTLCTHSRVDITAAKRDCRTTLNTRWIYSALAKPA